MTREDFLLTDERKANSKAWVAVENIGIKEENGAVIQPQRLDKDKDPLKKWVAKKNLNYFLKNGWKEIIAQPKGVKKAATKRTAKPKPAE